MNNYDNDVSDLIGERPTWQHQAACKGLPQHWWFPEASQNSNAAKRVCRTCPVLEQCGAYAAGNNERHGVWAAQTLLERRKNKGVSNLSVLYGNDIEAINNHKNAVLQADEAIKQARDLERETWQNRERAHQVWLDAVAHHAAARTHKQTVLDHKQDVSQSNTVMQSTEPADDEVETVVNEAIARMNLFAYRTTTPTPQQ